MIWGMDNNAKPEFPSPTEFGWKKEGLEYKAIITNLNPAPDSIIELVKCGCMAGKCQSSNCSCRRAAMVCTQMCKCEGNEQNCENMTINIHEESDEEDEEEV